MTPAQVPVAFEVNYARWWLAEAVDEDEVLKRFVSAEHELRIQEFRALDDEFTRVSREWIRAKLCANLPTTDNIQRNSEWGILRHEITKKKQHKPLRQLLQATDVGEVWGVGRRIGKQLKEQGIQGFDYSTWFALTAPKGTPKEVVDRRVPFAEPVKMRLKAFGRVRPSETEVRGNPRSRSAIMRMAERTEVPA